MAEEINEVTRSKKTLLWFFCAALEFIGWILIVVGVVWFARLVSKPGVFDMENNLEKSISIISWYSFDFFFLGLVVVILARLARYIFDKNYHKVYLLRFADKVLYLFAVFTIWWAAFRWAIYKNIVTDMNWQTTLTQLLLLPTVAKVLILICVAQILKRILPVIEEAKSLV